LAAVFAAFSFLLEASNFSFHASVRRCHSADFFLFSLFVLFLYEALEASGSFLLEALEASFLAASCLLEASFPLAASLLQSFFDSFLAASLLLAPFFLPEASDSFFHASVRRCLSADCFHASFASAPASQNAAAPGKGHTYTAHPFALFGLG